MRTTQLPRLAALFGSTKPPEETVSNTPRTTCGQGMRPRSNRGVARTNSTAG